MFAMTRMLHAHAQTVLHIQSLNRIRHFFTELDPGAKPYFTLPTHDDMADAGGWRGARGPAWGGAEARRARRAPWVGGRTQRGGARRGGSGRRVRARRRTRTP